MELKQAMITYCEAQPWDEDIRQDVYAKILETAETPITEAWLSTVYHNLKKNNLRDERRRAEIRTDNHDAIVNTLGLNDEEADPLDSLMQDEDIQRKLKLLTPLLLQTLIRVFVEGMSPEELAKWESTTANTIYQRIHQTRKLLEGDDT